MDIPAAAYPITVMKKPKQIRKKREKAIPVFKIVHQPITIEFK